MEPKNRYEVYHKRTKKGGRRRFGLMLFDFISLTACIVLAVLLLLSYFARYVDPNDISVFAVLGLMLPGLYIANIVMALYWVIRWKRWVFVPLVVLVLGISSISLLFRPAFSRSYDSISQKGDYVFVSSNVMGFIDNVDGKYVSCLDSTLSLLLEYSPDIIAMQEFQITPIISKNKVDQHLSRLPYSLTHFSIPSQYGGWGLAIYSRFPVIKSGIISFDNSNNSAMWADLMVKKDTIRVFNCHLQTTSVNTADKNFITDEVLFVSPSNKKERIFNIFSKWLANAKIRAKQADSIAVHIAQSPHKVIVCGDFNDTPISYTYSTIRNDLRDSFVERGVGAINTYQGLFNLFRIDYVLHSKEISCKKYLDVKAKYTDHSPVIVEFK